jgi:hypothetical protein
MPNDGFSGELKKTTISTALNEFFNNFQVR